MSRPFKLFCALLAILSLALAWGAVRLAQPFAGGPPQGLTPGRVDAERLKAHVRALSEGLPPRDWRRPEAMARSVAYVEAALRETGARVERQAYTLRGEEHVNVLASFGPEGGERVVVGAHVDAAEGLPGADDNASGVAGLLELARLLAARPPALRVDLVAYALEEPPHFRTPAMGSRRHARSLTEAGVKVRAVLVLEMIGTFTDAEDSQRYPAPALRALYPSRGNFIAVVGRLGGDDALTARVKASMRCTEGLAVESINAPPSLPGVDFSDHASYWPEGLSAVMVTDTAFYRNPRYHTPEDTWDTLDYARMARVVEGVGCAVQALAGQALPGAHGAVGAAARGVKKEASMHAEVEGLLARLSSRPVRGHSTVDFGRERNPAARSVVVPEEGAEALVRALRRELPGGFVAFVGTSRWLGEEKHEGAVEVVVGPGASQFDILRIARSDAVNYDLGTEDLVRRLQQYDRDVGISLLRAETDTVVFELLREPRDWGAFARDVYAFCPDTVDQGAGDVGALERDLRTHRRVLLWWD